MKNVLDKKVKGNLFKGVTNREFCDEVVNYFLPNFRNPIQYISTNETATFQAAIGKDNASDLKLFSSEPCNGKFYVVIRERHRTFKTQLLPEMVNYISQKLNPTI